jgi:hypothetical protein
MAARPDDLVAYTYRADVYGPCCILRAFHGSPTGEPPIAGMSIEQHLDVLARLRGVDRSDEGSFDSGDFPKPVRRSELTICGHCNGEGQIEFLYGPRGHQYHGRWVRCGECDGSGSTDRCGRCRELLAEVIA